MFKRQIPVDDETIVELLFNRKEIALYHTSEKYGKEIRRIAYNILRNNQDSEECENDTYLEIWRTIPPTRPNSYHAFILKLARNISINAMRIKTRKSIIPAEVIISMGELEETLAGGETPDKEYLIKEIGKLVSEFIKTLSGDMQYAFIDRYYFSTPVSEIAEIMGKSESWIHRELKRVREELRKYLEKNGVYV